MKQAVKDIKNVAKQAGKVVAFVTSDGFKECVSAAVDFIPVAGNIKSGVEAITGYDPITGRKLEPWERAVSTVGILGGPAAKAVKHGGKLAVKGGKFLQQQGSKLAQQGGKLVEKGGNLLGKVADVLDSSRTQLAGAGAGLGKFSFSTGISAGKKTTTGSKQLGNSTSSSDRKAKGSGTARDTDESNYVYFNKTHKDSLPKPKGYGPNGGELQSHHGLQKQWAMHNLSQYGYKPELAPTITIETGKGLPHTIITNAQNARRNERIASSKGKWSSTLQEELQFIVDDLTKAGFSRNTIRQVLEQQYKMLDKLGVKYERIDF